MAANKAVVPLEANTVTDKGNGSFELKMNQTIDRVSLIKMRNAVIREVLDIEQYLVGKRAVLAAYNKGMGREETNVLLDPE